MSIIYRSPESEQELSEYFNFRWENLRKPLGLELGSERDELEDTTFHFAAFKNNNIIGVGRLQIETDLSARIRYMAIAQEFRKQGIGSNLLEKIEDIARKENVKTCWLLARDTAASFYLKNNYQMKGVAESELAIKHHRMEKSF